VLLVRWPTDWTELVVSSTVIGERPADVAARWA
jgi:hypothetical protein